MKFRLLDELAWTYKRIHTDSALMFGEQGLDIADELNEPFLKAIILATIGVTMRENGIPDYGVSKLKESLQIRESLGNQEGIASALTNLGTSYHSSSKLDSAVICMVRAIEIKKEIGNLGSAASTMSNLSLVYREMQNFDKAEAYLLEALEIVGTNSNRSRGMLNNLGLIQLHRENYDQAIQSFSKAISGLDTTRFKREFASTYGNLAIAYKNSNRLDSAIYFGERSLRMKRQLGQRDKLSHPAITLAQIYIELDQLRKAKEYAQLAVEVTDSSGLERRSASIETLAHVEAKLENYERAAQLYQEYSVLKDSLHSERAIEAAEVAEAQFQNRLKEKENSLLEEKSEVQEEVIKNQRLLLISIGAGLLLLLITVYLLRRQSIERKRLLTKIEQQAAKLQELDKAKTRFFANISHDLRTPLSLIMAAFDNIQSRDGKYLDKESHQELDVGYKNAKRLLFMADEIMDLTRLENGNLKIKLQFVKIPLYLQLLVKMFHSAADMKNIKLSYQSKIDQDTLMEVDPYQFEKVIYNLLSNAIKHTPSKGSIDVILEQDGKSLAIRIRDTGAGIPANSLPHIFDRFYQSAASSYSAREGLGIGLALVKEIIDSHDGEIEVESVEGQGTTFKITFPHHPSKWTSEANIPQPSTQLISKNSLWTELQEDESGLQLPGIDSKADGKTVLIVEDHKEVRAYIKTLLRSQFRILTATNGVDALEILAKEKVDVILTDLMMPVMDGFELMDQLLSNNNFKKIPVIIISARNSPEEKIALLDKGVQEVMTKPFDKDELIAKINNLLQEEWNSEKQLSITPAHLDDLEKEVLKKVENLVLSRIDDPHLSILDLSNELAASERKVYRLIKRLSGITPYEFIKEIRWQFIFNKLQEESFKTATEAANAIGMANPTDFSRQFEKRFGQSVSSMLDK